MGIWFELMVYFINGFGVFEVIICYFFLLLNVYIVLFWILKFNIMFIYYLFIKCVFFFYG